MKRSLDKSLHRYTSATMLLTSLILFALGHPEAGICFFSAGLYFLLMWRLF